MQREAQSTRHGLAQLSMVRLLQYRVQELTNSRQGLRGRLSWRPRLYPAVGAHPEMVATNSTPGFAGWHAPRALLDVRPSPWLYVVVLRRHCEPKEDAMKNLLPIIAIAVLTISFSPEAKAQPTGAATKSTAAMKHPAKGMAGKQRMRTTCTPHQKMSGKPCS